jgi:hypothetical protein
LEGLASVPDNSAHHVAGGVLEVCLGSPLHSQQEEHRGATGAQRPATAFTWCVLCHTPPGRASGVVLPSLTVVVSNFADCENFP